MVSSDKDEDAEEEGPGAAPKIALPARGFAPHAPGVDAARQPTFAGVIVCNFCGFRFERTLLNWLLPSSSRPWAWPLGFVFLVV